MKLDELKIIVTGGAQGMGAYFASRLAEAGAQVAAGDVNEDGLARLPASVHRRRLNVADEADCGAFVAWAHEKMGGLNGLINNAGILRDGLLVKKDKTTGAIQKLTIDQWNQVIGVNLTGAFMVAREAAREFTRRGMRDVSRALGKIIFTSSVHQEIPWAGHCNYATTKGGIMQLMESIAQELAPQKIRVNSVCPGAIETAINTKAWSTPQAAASLEKLIPYGRIGVPADIAKVAAWLASDESDYICGASIYVDGGMTLYPGFATGG